MFWKIDILKNFAIFAGKHLSWSLFMIKLQARKFKTLWKRDFNTGVFLWFTVNIAKFLRTAFLKDNLRWRLLRLVVLERFVCDQFLIVFVWQLTILTYIVRKISWKSPLLLSFAEYRFIYLLIYLFIYLSIYLFIYLFIYRWYIK